MAHGPTGGDTPDRVGIVDLGDHDATRSDAPETSPPALPRRRRTVYLVGLAAALLVLAANIASRGEGPPRPERGVQAQDRALSVCEAVSFANQTGGLPSRPTVLPARASGYFAFIEPTSRSTVVGGLAYQDGTVSLCRPVPEPGTGSPKPLQRQLPVLGTGETYAYEMRPGGLTLIGERAVDGTIVRYEDRPHPHPHDPAVPRSLVGLDQ
ncbi:hypothetical protein [Arthrobacter sp. B1805]|uniref:hypothetical protein n=1 Tax=Arthrobacter sp. B1805 TaxID=2058892 RepID=UPI000CE2B8FC|nr:hypothetical protein [Arthrobacter sp. B1805]